MGKPTKNISLGLIRLLAEEKKQYYIDENIYIAMNAKDFGKKFLRYGQPYLVKEGRVMVVTEGWVKVSINMMQYRLTRHSVVVLVANSVFEIEAWSDDFDMHAFSFNDLSVVATSLHRHFVTSLKEDEWLLCEAYIKLLWREAHLQPLLLDAVKHLQTALLLELQRIDKRETAVRQKTATRTDEMFHRFIDLVNQNGNKERRIDFYADKLCVTPNYLGTVIKQASGLTVMQWLNRYIIQQSKLLLRYSDIPVWEISERLNFSNSSFFVKFFKRETGMTPKSFREM